MEGVLAGCIPIVPDRASYHEMYLDEFKYPSQWTESYSAYEQHKDLLIEFILNRMNLYSTYENKLKEQKDILNKHYLNADVMINNLVR
jgi:hypothetical protein